MTTTTTTTITSPRREAEARRAERQGVVAGIPAAEYDVVGDTFGPHPHLVVTVKHVDHVHHATVTAAARRIVKAVWGEHAEVARLEHGRYEGVYCDTDVPLPTFMQERYGQYHTSGLVQL